MNESQRLGVVSSVMVSRTMLLRVALLGVLISCVTTTSPRPPVEDGGVTQDAGSPPDSGNQGGGDDAGSSDAGAWADAGDVTDGGGNGSQDAGTDDAGGSVVDAGADAGVLDAGEPPFTPTGLSVTSTSSTSVSVSWVDNATNEDGFTVERKVGLGGTFSTATTTAANVASWNDTGLSPNTFYAYRVKATNNAGASSYSNEGLITTAPSPPTGLAAVPSGAQVGLSWSPATGASTYRFLRSTAADGGYSSIGTTPDASVSDPGLARGATYYYVVRSIGIQNESENSAEVNATIAPAAPSGVAAFAGARQVAVTWDASVGASSYRLVRSPLADAGPYTNIADIAATTFTDMTVSNNQLYFFSVYAGNDGGWGPQSESVAALPACVWGTPQRVSAAGSVDAGAADLAIDTAGNAVAVWHQLDTNRRNIWGNRYSFVSGVWDDAGAVGNDPWEATNPRVAVDPMGRPMAVWSQIDGSVSNIYSNRYDVAINTWDAGQQVGSTTAGTSTTPSIAFDGVGNAFAVWTRNGLQVMASRYLASTGRWDAGSVVSDAGYQSVLVSPLLAVDTAGNATVLWNDYIPGSCCLWTPEGRVYAKRWSSGNWGNPTVIWAEYSSWLATSGIGTDQGGNVIALAHTTSSPGDFYRVFASRFGISGETWASPQKVLLNYSRHPSQTSLPDFPSQGIAVAPGGDAIAAWAESDGGTTPFNVWAARYDAGAGGWEAPRRLESNTGSDQSKAVKVAVDQFGNAFVIWEKPNGALWNTAVARYFVAPGLWTDAGIIQTNAGVNGLFPRVTADNTGNAYATWTENGNAVWSSVCR